VINTFSYSAITTFENCPLAFRFRYLEKRPEAFVTIETHMGRAVHGALHRAYSIPGGPGCVKPETLEAHYRELWREEDPARLHVVRRGAVLQEYYQSGLEMLLAFRNRIMREDRRVSLGLERDFCLELSPEVMFRGVVDRIARQEDGRLRVIDYKTGRTGEPLDSLQLPAYAVFAFTLTSDDAVELCFEDLRQQVSRIAVISRARAEGVRSDLLEKIARIRRETDFPPRPSPLCRWCGFSPDCPGVQGMPPPPEEPARSGELSDSCPECGAPLVQRNGRYGTFMGCSAYPNCRYTLDIEHPQAEVPGERICPECGSPLRERKGRFGRFLGCSRYPACRFSRDLTGTGCGGGEKSN